MAFRNAKPKIRKMWGQLAVQSGDDTFVIRTTALTRINVKEIKESSDDSPLSHAILCKYYDEQEGHEVARFDDLQTAMTVHNRLFKAIGHRGVPSVKSFLIVALVSLAIVILLSALAARPAKPSSAPIGQFPDMSALMAQAHAASQAHGGAPVDLETAKANMAEQIKQEIAGQDFVPSDYQFHPKIETPNVPVPDLLCGKGAAAQATHPPK